MCVRSLLSFTVAPLLLLAGCQGADYVDPESAAPETVDTAVSEVLSSSWSVVSGVEAATSPALASLNGSLHMVAVNTLGSLRYASTRTLAGGWSTWQDAGRPAATLFNSGTAPVLVADRTTLNAFARGLDGNLYRATRALGATTWSAFSAVTTHGRVRGRISVAFSRYALIVNGEPGPQVLVTHALFPSASGSVEYDRFENGSLVATTTFAADEGGIGSNGSTETFVALRTRTALTVQRATRGPSGWGFTQAGSRATLGGLGRVYDVSDLTFFAGAFHVVYAYRTQLPPDYNTGYRFAHARFIPGRADDGFSRTLSSFLPSQDPDAAGTTATGRLVPEGTLAVYRNKLVLAYRNHDGAVRYARWDNADPDAPWLGHTTVGGGYSRRRPAAAAFDGRAGLSDADYASANYSHDLFAATLAYSGSTVSAIDFSRAILRQDAAAQFNLYNSNTDGAADAGSVCRTQSEAGAPTPVSISSDDRPVVSELGFALWALPDWFSRGLFQQQAVDFCNTLSTWPASGRVPASCNSTTRMPVIVRSINNVFICRGAWIGRSNLYGRIFEELGHYATNAMGIEGSASSLPTSTNADRTGISLSALQLASSLFNQRVGNCASTTTRCSGFLGVSDSGRLNYDANSREHSFLYAVLWYMNDGATLRGLVADDLEIGDTLLQRKYNWVRDNIFGGIEFDRDLNPIAPL